jgi:NADH:ubiquinone oxidoreductase subunit F (NADH-binding)
MTVATPGRLLTPVRTWTEHLAWHGVLPAVTADQLLTMADAGEVRGRGGGGFPLGRKLRAAAEHGRGTVVGNCAEGEPASHKDRALLDTTPHLVVDGLLLAARATRATRLVLAAHEGAMARRVRHVLAERDDVHRVEVLELPHRYVAGEASALVRALRGGPFLPQQRPAPLATGRRPHLVQNAETLACLALLARGHRSETSLLTMGGAVVRPGVVEVMAGTTVRAAVRAVGGFAEPAQALLVGGYFGRWLAAEDALDAPLTVDGMRAVGGSLGAGIVLALPVSACGLAATAQVLRYLADQSARQCGPCLNGLPAMATTLEQLAAGAPPADAIASLERWSAAVTGRGACAHPDGAAALLTSALHTFGPDVQTHLTRACGRPAGAWLDVPR